MCRTICRFSPLVFHPEENLQCILEKVIGPGSWPRLSWLYIKYITIKKNHIFYGPSPTKKTQNLIQESMLKISDLQMYIQFYICTISSI